MPSLKAAGCRAERLVGAPFLGGSDLGIGGLGWKAIWLCQIQKLLVAGLEDCLTVIEPKS